MNQDSKSFSIGRDIIIPVLRFLFWLWVVVTVIRAIGAFVLWVIDCYSTFIAYQERKRQTNRERNRELILYRNQPPIPSNAVKYGLYYRTALDRQTYTWEPEVIEEHRMDDIKRLGPEPCLEDIIEINSHYVLARNINHMYQFVCNRDRRYMEQKMEEGFPKRHVQVGNLSR